MKDRHFESADADGKVVKLVFKRPNQNQITQGDFVYRKFFSEAIRAGLMANAEATKVLKDRGIWTDDMDKQERSMRQEINRLEASFANNEFDRAAGLLQVDELKLTRRKLKELTSIYTDITDNTAESVAVEARIQYFAAECTLLADSMKKMFKNVDDYRLYMSAQMGIDAYKHAVICNFELALGREMPDVSGEYPEDKWLNSLPLDDIKEPATEEVKTEEPKKRGRKSKVLV